MHDAYVFPEGSFRSRLNGAARVGKRCFGLCGNIFSLACIFSYPDSRVSDDIFIKYQ
jgi:hypothetical protein